jgi:hypothetical protein
MPIRYRVAAEEGRSREGAVEDVGELQWLVSLGTISPRDEVALDGEHYRQAKKLAELKDVFAERQRRAGTRSGPSLLLIVGAGLVGVVALGLALKIVSTLIGIAAIGALGLGAVWVIRRLMR